jgi:peptide/nickel transport system permease protein
VLRFLGQKLLHMVIVLFLVSLATYSMLDLLPGSPAYTVLGAEATPDQVATIEHQLELDQPFVERYARWLGNAVHGDLGTSLRDKQPVSHDISERLPVTLELAALAILTALVIAIPIAMAQAYREGRVADKVLSFGAFLVISMPPFLTAVLLVYAFALKLTWLPVTGWARISEAGIGENLRYAVLPVLSLALTEVAVFSQVLRGDLLTTLREDHVLSARAIGLPTRTILTRYALRPSSFSLATLAAVNLGRLIGGAVIIETIFAVPGIGKMLVDAILGKDVVKVQAAVLVIATLYVLINAAVELLYQWLDPRVRRGRG